MYLDEGGDEHGDLTVAAQDHEGDAPSGVIGVIGVIGSHLDGPADLSTAPGDGELTGAGWGDGSAGRWIGVEPAGPGGAELRVDSPDGELAVGPATVDTDGDGRPDTVVVHGADGGMILYTDKDGDGAADQATEIDADGRVTVTVHLGPGRWHTVQSGHLDGGGNYVPDDASAPPADDPSPTRRAGGWGGAATGSPDGLPHIDPATGDWTGVDC